MGEGTSENSESGLESRLHHGGEDGDEDEDEVSTLEVEGGERRGHGGERDGEERRHALSVLVVHEEEAEVLQAR